MHHFKKNVTLNGFVPTLGGLKTLVNLMSSGDYMMTTQAIKDGEVVQELKFYANLISL
jgi:hypothetical protein